MSRVRIAVAIAAAAAVAVAGASATSSPAGKLVRVNGHRLYLECAGKGSPSVVVEGGLGESTLYFTPVQAAVAKLTRVCSYDRLGVGRSDRAAGARPVTASVDDLHKLLRTAGVKPPYVLASHSIGGLIDRYYTKVYPREVAGLVMAESAPDDWDVFQKMTTFTGGEALDIGTAAAALREGDDLGSRPVVVIQAGKFDQLGRGNPEFAPYWQSAQKALAARSTDSIFVVAARSDHEVEYDQPALLSASVKLVVAAVRTKKPLPACAATTLPKLGGRC